jgi:hypothetical protein
MRVNPFVMPIIVIVALLGTVFGAQAMGLWSTSSRTTTNLAGMTPADIKGWMTLQQVMDGLSISQNELYTLGGIPGDISPATALKDLEALVPGFETSALRDALLARLSTPGNDATLPAGTSSPVEADTANTPEPPSATAITPSGESQEAATQLAEQALPADQIKGKMTLREVSTQCAVPLEALLTALGLPTDTDPDAAIKDLVEQGKVAEVATVQEAVSALQKQ